ncbi:MAG: flavoprotein, partial [Novosphingobium sp.]
MGNPRILLVVGGGIAAYKACELVRLIRRGGGDVTCVLTEGGAKFITAMTLAALSENPVHTTLWDLTNEVEMGHIQLSRSADLVVVCPATADLIARMAHGIADDLATTLLLATDTPVLVAPAMNVKMWENPATQSNVHDLAARGIHILPPDEGPMACGEYGAGRLPEPIVVYNAVRELLGQEPMLLPSPDPVAAFDLEHWEAPTDGIETSISGLTAGLIQRSGARAPILFDDEPIEGEFAELEPAVEEAPIPVDLSGPILSKKGKAKAAPPTDPEAINHTVSRHDSPPEPFDEGALAADPLAGQPDFAPDEIAPEDQIDPEGPLKGKHILITAGPT